MYRNPCWKINFYISINPYMNILPYINISPYSNTTLIQMPPLYKYIYNSTIISPLIFNTSQCECCTLNVIVMARRAGFWISQCRFNEIAIRNYKVDIVNSKIHYRNYEFPILNENPEMMNSKSLFETTKLKTNPESQIEITM